MKREEVKELFPEATEEQIDGILNKFGEELNPVKKQLKDAESERDEAQSALAASQADAAGYKTQLDEANAKLEEGMTAEERIAAREKAADDREREFNLKSNGLDAKEIFVQAGCFEEEEIAELDDEEKAEFLADLGLSESGLDKLIKASYSILGLTSFLTAGEKEVRAWTITKGMKAPQAAGKIHTDFEKGFIKAEVVNYHDLIEIGSYSGAREKGLIRMEGKDYVVQDDDIILFRFNV